MRGENDTVTLEMTEDDYCRLINVIQRDVAVNTALGWTETAKASFGLEQRLTLAHRNAMQEPEQDTRLWPRAELVVRGGGGFIRKEPAIEDGIKHICWEMPDKVTTIEFHVRDGELIRASMYLGLELHGEVFPDLTGGDDKTLPVIKSWVDYSKVGL